MVVFDLLFNLFRIALWERAVPLAFHLCCFYFSAVLIVGFPFLFGVYGRKWNSIVSVPDRCLFFYLLCMYSSRFMKINHIHFESHCYRSCFFYLGKFGTNVVGRDNRCIHIIVCISEGNVSWNWIVSGKVNILDVSFVRSDVAVILLCVCVNGIVVALNSGGVMRYTSERSVSSCIWRIGRVVVTTFDVTLTQFECVVVNVVTIALSSTQFIRMIKSVIAKIKEVICLRSFSALS